ncbi:MAG: DinB family protein [Planctomycetota bacterium]
MPNTSALERAAPERETDMALEQEMTMYRFLQNYGEGLLGGLDADRAFVASTEGGHHPAWILGHLALVGNQGAQLLGGTPAIDIEAWKPLFGIGSQPTARAESYPEWAELVGAWRQTREVASSSAAAIDEEKLNEPNPIERRRDTLPTLGNFVGFIFTSHEAVHLGQLSAWRRGQGLPPLF